MAKRARKSPRGNPEAPAAEARITVSLSRPGCKSCEHIDPQQISDYVGVEGAVLWVDVADPGPHEIERLREEFGFHRLALEDVVHQRQRPKVDEYPDYFFVVMYAPLPAGPDEDLQTVELDVFVGKNYLVTCHRGQVPSLQDAFKRWERTEPELRKQVGFLLHVVADAVIDSYFPIVDGIEDRLDSLEMAMFSRWDRYDPEELLAIKRNLYTLRKAIYPLREVFNTFLRRDQGIFSPETYPYFQDAYDHVLRLLDIIDIERDMATGTLEAQLSVVSNRLNETMQRLTVFAICVTIMGAIFGAWGMNFDEVPLHQMGALGFWVLCGVTVVLMGVVLVIAKRLRYW